MLLIKPDLEIKDIVKCEFRSLLDNSLICEWELQDDAKQDLIDYLNNIGHKNWEDKHKSER